MNNNAAKIILRYEYYNFKILCLTIISIVTVGIFKNLNAKLIIDSCDDSQQNSILAECRDSFFDISFRKASDPLIGSYIKLFDKFMGKADIKGKFDILLHVIKTGNMLAIEKVFAEVKGQTIELFQKYSPLVAETIQRQSHFEESDEKPIEILTQNEETLKVQDECNTLMGDNAAETD